ncbi:hypothetical protein BST83_07885 [Polaribacter filamentus]|jgi:hypothetical protein|uniref:2TM domain-containing protein n=1 Tax=Polaribacter filamentus TaxID=53483 RepID=A0A2S7KWV6_9FLAO|nr:2TM domain-containing protein [Polaribacter filamentus]PQB07076.1 hypothetical protein BST83_07885 [Polaribacter filamentus]
MESTIKKSTYKQAEKRVKRIRDFYNHLQIFVIIMAPILLFSNAIIGFFESYIDNGNTLEWVKVNIWINTLLWFIGVAIHGLFVFKVNLIDKWEKNKVAEFMNRKD